MEQFLKAFKVKKCFLLLFSTFSSMFSAKVMFSDLYHWTIEEALNVLYVSATRLQSFGDTPQ